MCMSCRIVTSVGGSLPWGAIVSPVLLIHCYIVAVIGIIVAYYHVVLLIVVDEMKIDWCLFRQDLRQDINQLCLGRIHSPLKVNSN